VVKQRSEIHIYHLEVSLTNRGTVPLGNFHIDLQMPTVVIKNPQDSMYFVPNRSTRYFAFFRLISERHCPLVKFFPGDTNVVMAIEYFMDHDIYFNRGDLFNKSVRVEFYHHGYRSVTIEKKFGDLQIFLDMPNHSIQRRVARLVSSVSWVARAKPKGLARGTWC
jgi:hypothetical protein